MEVGGINNLNQIEKFKSPEEELDFLRKQVEAKEKELADLGVEKSKDDVIGGVVEDYKNLPKEDVLHESFKISEKEEEKIILDLAPEAHDKKMEELLKLLDEKGILNTISMIEKLETPHIEDDFHRLLVQWIKKGLPVTGLKESAPMYKGLHMTLYEVSLPEAKTKDGERKALKEMISAMEQFYAGMFSVSDNPKKDHNYFSIELANPEGSQEFIFHVAVPDEKKDLFEKQIISIFPEAKVEEKKDDYNIFNQDGFTSGSYASLSKNAIFPIKTYEQFDYDPLNVTLNALSKLDELGEGASIQILIRPAGDVNYISKYKDALKDIMKGTSVKKAVNKTSTWGAVWEEIKDAWKDLKGGDKKEDKPKPIDEISTENIKQKIMSPIAETNIRIVASAKNRQRTDEILSHLESSFNQFENSTGNKFTFKRQDGAGLKELERRFSFRMFSEENLLPLSVHEITTVMHFPQDTISSKSSPQLKQAKAGTAPVPVGLPQIGTLLGENIHRGQKSKVYITKEDRMRHFYVIGQTGTGKTTLLKNMILQDIKDGHGICFIDPHGSDVQDILSHIPEERYDDVIYFDPSYTARPMALNMLEYDPRFPEQKTFVVNELFSIFQKLYGGVPESMGPIFEQYFRNATMLVIEDPETGNTLVDVSRVMADASYRKLKLSRCKNPIVVQFWREIAEKAGGEASLANIVPYITSKFDVFLANEIMRPIIAQEKSSFDFREVMDSKKILLVNLAKGRLGDINSSLIGLIIVGKILMAALSRVDSFGKDMNDFYLYIDEFQNITTPSISTILSEARKYRLSLNMAHQFIAQLDEKIRDSVFGNVGSMAVFRVGSEDAEFLVKQFDPVFTPNDLMNVDNLNCYLKLLSSGKPVRPFNVLVPFPEKGRMDIVDKLKDISHLKYGRPREDIEEEIMERYEKKEAPSVPRFEM